MTKWEYEIVKLNPQALLEQSGGTSGLKRFLDSWGKGEWELVQIVVDKELFIFKREVPESTPESTPELQAAQKDFADEVTKIVSWLDKEALDDPRQ